MFYAHDLYKGTLVHRTSETFQTLTQLSINQILKINVKNKKYDIN